MKTKAHGLKSLPSIALAAAPLATTACGSKRPPNLPPAPGTGDGSDQRRISFGGGGHATPEWSPRGDLIAFTQTGSFRVGVMRPDGSGARLLTRDAGEGPTWAPNGRVLMFFREARGGNGGPQLWSVDITGYNEQVVPTPSFASDPAWSPLLG